MPHVHSHRGSYDNNTTNKIASQYVTHNNTTSIGKLKPCLGGKMYYIFLWPMATLSQGLDKIIENDPQIFQHPSIQW